MAVSRGHVLLTKHILPPRRRGKLLTSNRYVTTPVGRIAYVAATPDEVPGEMKKFYADVATLLNEKLSFAEVFYVASVIHLAFVKIHPFDDGNGRTARLLEK